MLQWVQTAALSVVVLSTLSGCGGAAKPSTVKSLKDAKSIHAAEAGVYDIECQNGTRERRTKHSVQKDDVCIQATLAFKHDTFLAPTTREQRNCFVEAGAVGQLTISGAAAGSPWRQVTFSQPLAGCSGLSWLVLADEVDIRIKDRVIPTTEAYPSTPGEPTRPTPPPADPTLPDPAATCAAVQPSGHPLTIAAAAPALMQIDFANPGDRSLQVIDVYVTAPGDQIPTFPKFKFSGTAYWMIEAPAPFKAQFQLPVVYGTTPQESTDVTKHYGGIAGGGLLARNTVPTCVQVNVVTLETNQEVAFVISKSTFLYQPHN